ncbi:MAG: hypothetical protein Q7U75_08555 [Desulfobacterales bacterium]|nr:hypothetical protein [Desulfobacterales bacterium]
MSNDTIIQGFELLIPGFLAAALYYALTASRKPPQFERIIHALVFTAIIRVLVGIIRQICLLIGRIHEFGKWSQEGESVISLIIAFALGLFLVKLTNTDSLHNIMRMLRITNLTSYPSVWYGAVSKHGGYAVLHLKDERRLYGEIEEWPTYANRDYMLVNNADWLVSAYDESNMHNPMSQHVIPIGVNVKVLV